MATKKKAGKKKGPGGRPSKHGPSVRLLAFKLRPEDYDTLKELADEIGCDMSRFARRAIFAAFEEHGRSSTGDY